MTTFFAVSCSEDSAKMNENSSFTETLQKDDSWPCPDGYEFVAVKKFKLKLFKAGPTPSPGDELCSSGLGFCFSFTGEIVFDCVKLKPMPAPVPAKDLNFDPASDEGDVYIQQMDDSHVAICFSEDAVYSPSHIPSDFDQFNTVDLVLGNKIKLVAGSYPKEVSGNIIYYTIPFNYVP